MIEREAKEPIRIYLDDSEEPFKVAHPPLRFSLSTIPMADGAHTLRVEASNGLAPPTVKEIPFRVRNGVAVTVSGLEAGQTIGGQVELIVNAYAGNTEVDFEPRRAETPQPIPTWAWVLSLGVLAWTMFYIFNPARPPRDAAAKTFTVDRSVGERLYMDACARCHDENGTGRRSAANPDEYIVKKLRDTPNLAVDESPYKLLFKVVTGVRSIGDVLMPAWGPRLTNEEIVAVVNYVRSSWGHDASQIQPTYRQPPPGIAELEENILNAMARKDVQLLESCCWPEGVRPQLYRIDGPRWAVGKADVLDEWAGYFEALGKGEIVDFQLTDVRYAYEPEAVNNVGAYVFAMGRIFLSTRAANGADESDTGRFIRVYRRVQAPSGGRHADAAEWALVFDFASIRMRVGCEVDGELVDCPPDQLPTPGTTPVVSLDNDIGYAEVQAMFAGLKKDAGDSGHGRFWELSYDEFIELTFPPTWDDTDLEIQMLVRGKSTESNLIKALRDGKGITVKRPDGSIARMNIALMPKGSSMPKEQVDKLAAWIDAGCPKVAGETSTGGGEAKGPTKDADPKKSAGSSSGPIGYEDVKNIFASLGRDPGDAPHDRFWELPYEEFVGQAFPWSWDEPEMTVSYVIPWSSKASNLIKALVDGKGIEVRMPDGRMVSKNIKRMPKGASAMPDEDIQRIADWIDAGCPKEPGGPSSWPKPGAEAAPPAKDGAKAGAPVKAPVVPPVLPPEGHDAEKDPPQPVPPENPPPPPPPPPAPKDVPKAPAAAKPEVSSLGFEDVIQVFKRLRQKAPNAPHSNFWRELPYDEFVAFAFPEGPGKQGMIRLLVPWDSAASNMIKAMKDGKGLTVRYPDGRVETRDIAPMPKDADPMPAAELKKLADWIDAGCPEHAGKPSALPKR